MKKSVVLRKGSLLLTTLIIAATGYYLLQAWGRWNAVCGTENISPDMQFGLKICKVKGETSLNASGVHVVRIYQKSNGELILEKKQKDLYFSSITPFWACKDGKCFVVWSKDDDGSAELPPDFFTRLRAKLP